MAKTWGQLRRLLSQRFPVLSIDQLTGAIQSAYHDILDRQAWTQLHRTGYLQTVARADAVVTLTNGSETVTGTGFDSAWDGRKLRLSDPGATYTVTYVSATELTLDRPYEGEDATDADAYIFQNIYELPIDCKSLKAIVNGYLDARMIPCNHRDLDDLSPNRVEFGEPAFWAPSDPVPESSDAVHVERVELYPIPTAGYAYKIEYDGAVNAFTGTNTQYYPVHWVSDDALECLASARCCMEPQVGQDPSAWMLRADVYIKRMVSADAKRQTTTLKVADSMTLHDRKRLAR